VAGVETAVVIGVEKVVRRERTMRVSVFRPNYLSFRPKNLDLLAQMSDIDPSIFIIYRVSGALCLCAFPIGVFTVHVRAFFVFRLPDSNKQRTNKYKNIRAVWQPLV
jgi:hypothetical protein